MLNTKKSKKKPTLFSAPPKKQWNEMTTAEKEAWADKVLDSMGVPPEDESDSS